MREVGFGPVILQVCMGMGGGELSCFFLYERGWFWICNFTGVYGDGRG